MSDIALVTDSTAYIPNEIVEKFNITVAPQVLIWGSETYEDGVDIEPQEFYERLEKSSVMPTTSQVTVAKFLQIFSQLIDEDKKILAMLISDQLSGTIASAVQAKENFPGATIEIFNSETTAMELGFQIISVARAIQEGASVEECLELAEKSKQHTGVLFAVDTLEFLHRGGRIGGGSRFLGAALNIKPILEVKDGKVDAVERVRTRKKSLQRMVDMVGERISGRQPVRLASLHANAPEEAQEVLKEIQNRFEPVETYLTQVSPVVGTHAGPGTVGIAYMAGM